MRKSVYGVSAALSALLGASVFACGGTTTVASGLVAAEPDGGGGTDANLVQAATQCSPDASRPTRDPDAGAFACPDDKPTMIGGQDVGFAVCGTTVSHRHEAVECPNTYGAAVAGLCTTDSECKADEICVCGEKIGNCQSATCKLDADCGPGLLCANVQSMTYTCRNAVGGYACQTAADECLRDSDCPGDTCHDVCALVAGGRRICQGACSPPQGRPFIVESVARVASIVPSAEWARTGTHPNTKLSRETRAKLAAEWTKIGQMEHASVAAFARFALELMALGAPAALLRQTQRAMADEIDHAERAFGLASAYGGRLVGPGPLDMSGALGTPTVRSVLATLLREGCIGETIAAVEAAQALEQATDPAVRETLTIIVRDETSHAALAWRTVEWMLDTNGDELREWLAEEFERALAERKAVTAAPRQAHDALLEAHGLVAEHEREELYSAALSDLVAPRIARVSARVHAAT